MLNRIWAGIVGAVAGAAIGLVVTIVLVQSGVSLETALNAVWAVASLCGVFGIVFGGARKNSPAK